MTELPLFSTTEEEAFKTCRQAHHFKYDLGFRKSLTARKLSVGIAVHAGLGAIYLGESVEAALDAYYAEREAEIAANITAPEVMVKTWAEFDKDKALIAAMVNGYSAWAKESGVDVDYTTVAVEEAYFVEVPGAPCILPVKLDLLQRNLRSGRLRMVDFKTRASFGTDTTGYQLSAQNGNYALGVLAQHGERPTEMAYRELRKIVPSAKSKPPYYREVRVRLTEAELLHRAEQYALIARERFNPERAIYSNPEGCCGSWKNDWAAPCLKTAQGMTAQEALACSAGYVHADDANARYDPTEDELPI